MRRTISTVGGVLALTLVALPAWLMAQNQGTGKSLYRWVDKEGRVHFSDAVPADAAKDERQIIDEHGTVRRVLPRQKTDAELVEEARHERELQQQANYDKSLLKTYLTIDDLKKAGNERIDTIDSHIEQAQKQVTDGQEKVAELRSKAASTQAAGQAVDPDLQRQIEQYESALLQSREQLSQLRQDRQRAEDQYIHDVERYKQLQAGFGITNNKN